MKRMTCPRPECGDKMRVYSQGSIPPGNTNTKKEHRFSLVVRCSRRQCGYGLEGVHLTKARAVHALRKRIAADKVKFRKDEVAA